MSLFKPTSDERETLKVAVAKFAHEPSKSQLLASLDVADSEYDRGVGDWDRLKYCVEHHLLHAQTEVRRDPNKKSAKLILTKADALARKFHPDFS
jgi:hypothetical protein